MQEAAAAGQLCAVLVECAAVQLKGIQASNFVLPLYAAGRQLELEPLINAVGCRLLWPQTHLLRRWAEAGLTSWAPSAQCTTFSRLWQSSHATDAPPGCLPAACTSCSIPPPAPAALLREEFCALPAVPCGCSTACTHTSAALEPSPRDLHRQSATGHEPAATSAPSRQALSCPPFAAFVDEQHCLDSCGGLVQCLFVQTLPCLALYWMISN